MYTFSQDRVVSRVGISWISNEQACRNVQGEIPHNTPLSKVVQDTKDVWNSKILSKITTSSTNHESLQLLYTSLYYMNLLPTNQTGEMPGWDTDEPAYSDIFTLWDLFRCSTSLMHVIVPDVYEEYIRSLISVFKREGYMPDARSSNSNGRTQVGSNADNVLADAYIKGVRGKINWDEGYAAMVKDAEVPPENPNPDPMAPDSCTKEGRGGLEDWLELGYITPKYSRAVCRAVEYAYNDFAVHQVAKGLGRADDAAKYLGRSRNWRNHWNPEVESLGFKGFVMPRDRSGFQEMDPMAGGYWGEPLYEGNSWIYSWTDVHDMAHIVQLCGGEENFYARLEMMFETGHMGRPDETLHDPSNEP